MADQQTHEMVSAYAAGCLDVDNFINFKEYLISDGDLPQSELGELQNVMALLSLTLETEQPPAALKASVAKKLISLKGEIKAKLKAEKESIDKLQETTVSAKETKISHSKLSVVKDLEDDKVTNFKNTRTGDERTSRYTSPEEKLDKTKKAEPLSEPVIEEKSENTKSNFYTEDVESKSKTAQQSKIGFFLSIAALVLIVIFTYLVFHFNGSAQEQIDEMKIILKDTQAKTSASENFIKEHRKLLEFFTYDNIAVINFDKPDTYSTATGKLFVSFDKKLGLLMVNNLPELISGEMYQLWLVSRGRSYPVISFLPKKDYNYIQISELPMINKSEIDLFRITSERKPNPDIPEGKTVLLGGFLK